MNKSEEKAPLSAAVAPAPRAQSYHNRPSELSPFSGADETSFGQNESFVTDDGDMYSIPSSSQDSAASFALGGQKRPWDLDSDILIDEDADRSLNNLSGSWHNSLHGRTILSPNLGQSHRILSVHHSKIAQPTMDLDDFEEATFLRRREEVDAEDVRMYGA